MSSKEVEHLNDLSPEVAAKFLVVLLLACLLLGFAYSALNPLGEAPDEADHYAYAAYVAREGHLPVGPTMTQGKHPPFYYLLSAGVIKLLGADPDFTFLRSNPDGGVGPAATPNFFVHTGLEAWPWRGGALAMHLARLVSVLAGVILVAGTYALGRAVWPSWYAGPLAAAAFVAFLPETLFVGGAMSNDMLAAMWTTLALWLLARALKRSSIAPRPSVVSAVLAGACLGLAFVTKASTGSLAIVFAVAFGAAAWPQGARRWPGLRALIPGIVPVLLAGLVAFGIALPWLWRNWRLYADPFGWPMVLATIDQRQGPMGLADVAQLLRGWWFSFWGKFGGAGHIALPGIFYIFWAVLSVSALAGWLVWLVRRRHSAGLIRQTTLSGWVILLGAPLVTAAGIYSYSQVALGTDQGRLLFPALGPLALLIAGGLSAWVPRHSLRLVSGLFAGSMAVIAAAALYAGVMLPFAPPPEPDNQQLEAAQALDVGFGPLALVAMAGDAPTSDQLTLYWRAAQHISDDLRTTLRLLDADGALLWEWKRSPGAGRFSTDRWPVGRLVADTYRIPIEILPKVQRVEIGLRPFPEGAWVPIVGHASDQLLTLPR